MKKLPKPKPKSKKRVNSNRSQRGMNQTETPNRSSPAVKPSRNVQKRPTKSPRAKTPRDKGRQSEFSSRKSMSGRNEAKLRRRRRLSTLRKRIRSWGQRHELPDWAQNQLMKQLKENQMRRKQENKVRQKLLGKESEVVTGMLKGKSGEDIYPVSRKQKSRVDKDMEQKSPIIRTEKKIEPKSNLAPRLFSEETVIYLPFEKKIHEFDLTRGKNKGKQVEMPSEQSKIEESQTAMKESKPILPTEEAETPITEGEKENEVTLNPEDVDHESSESDSEDSEISVTECEDEESFIEGDDRLPNLPLLPVKTFTKPTIHTEKSPVIEEKMVDKPSTSPISEVKPPKSPVSSATRINGSKEVLTPSPPKVSSREKWQSFYKYKYRPTVVQVTPIPVNGETIREENLYHMIKDEDRRDKRQMMKEKDAKTAYQIQESKLYWNPFMPLSELKKRNVLFTDAVTKENTIRSTAMVQPAPTDPKPSRRRRKREGKRVKITKKVVRDEYVRNATSKTAKSIFDLMQRRR